MVRPCDENERGAHSEKNARCGHTKEKKKRAAKPKTERCMLKRCMTEMGLKEDNTTKGKHGGIRSSAVYRCHGLSLLELTLH